MCNCNQTESYGLGANSLKFTGNSNLRHSNENNIAISTPTILNTMLSDLDTLNSRLNNAIDNLARNNDRVLGSAPCGVGGGKDQIGPSGHVYIAQELISKLYEKMTVLDAEIERLNTL